jgi:hypothetical protein
MLIIDYTVTYICSTYFCLGVLQVISDSVLNHLLKNERVTCFAISSLIVVGNPSLLFSTQEFHLSLNVPRDISFLLFLYLRMMTIKN